MVEAHAQLQEATQLVQDMLTGRAGAELFEAACEALNVAAVKLRFIQLELAAQEEEAVNPETAITAEDDTLPPD
ncbi:hypothetical protein [Chloracidobacterium thermophilum]|jgi:hypothetical protein|uniref:Uncharacterized protein n=1 Tax=Chloracidobacterium thermophilum (strain B) TaxID=981222 RepID=G2LGZ2_CHLTF|nr:hypothetical protein [Chloracidobacterium thermophilum]AEP11492.1 hypothetical protein Cabther_A0735 [Chloracidobacterium thermophilum B]QUV79388.1 hypothetical protein J8C08_03745 [Chloracidobacterium thermophilum]